MNRLKLDFSLESAKERVDFISTYIKQFDRLTEKELMTIEEYLLWGKGEDGVAVGAGMDLKTKWDKPKEAESLDAVLENPALANSQLCSLNDAVVYKKSRDVFSRSEARKQAPPFLVRLFEDLWRDIDETELEINFYEERVGKRDKPPREELLKRFTSEEIEIIRARSQKLNQYKYLKLRHKLKELRTEQFTIRDSYKSTFNITQSIYSPKEKTLVFDCDIEVMPLGVKEGEVGKLIFDVNFDPRALTEQQQQIISDLVWKKKEVKKEKIFDFRNLEMVYQLYLFKEELEDRVEKIVYDHLVENNLDKLIDTLSFYETIADLTDIQREILRLKEQKKKNTDIASYINKKYGKSYTANYISTIFKQKIIGRINEAVELHRDTIENCFFEENFKVCNDCGRILLLDGRNWVKKARSKDGFQNRCKRCEHEMRKKKKGGAKK
jgi:hypothetical protein